jgi:hypothetical protein
MYLSDLSSYLSMIENTITRAKRDVDDAQNCVFEFLKNHKKNAMIWIVNFCMGVGPIICNRCHICYLSRGVT